MFLLSEFSFHFFFFFYKINSKYQFKSYILQTNEVLKLYLTTMDSELL